MERAKHYNDEQLLAHLDGELPPGENDLVLSHLKVCWECRARAASLERQIETVAASLSQQTFPGHDYVMRAKERLQQSFLDFEYGEPPQPAVSKRNPVFPLRWGLAGALAAIAVVALGVVTRLPKAAPVAVLQEPPVRAVEEVRRVEAIQETAPVHQVIRTEVRALTGSKRVWKARLDVWEEPKDKRFAARWLDDSGRVLDGVWRSGDEQWNGLGVQPVSATSQGRRAALEDLVSEGFEPERVEGMFRRWVRSRQWRRVVFAHDMVLLADRDGAAVLAERHNGVARFTATSEKDGQRITIVLEIDEAQQSAISQQVRYEAQGKAVEIQLVTERRERVPRHLINPAVFRPPAVRPETTVPDLTGGALSPEPEIAAATVLPDLSAVAVQVEYLLHDMKACTGEPLTVRVEGPEVVVRGLVMEQEREHALAAALAELHAPVRLELQTYEQAARKVRAPKLLVTPQFARAAHLPLEQLLAKHFQQDDARIAAFTSAVIAAADQAMSQAWALRRLEERYDGARQDSLNAPSRRLVEAMKQDHKGAVTAAWREVHRLVSPLLATMQLTALPRLQVVAGGGFDSTNRCNRLVHALFAGAEMGDRSAEQAVSQLFAELSAVTGAASGEGTGQ